MLTGQAPSSSMSRARGPKDGSVGPAECAERLNKYKITLGKRREDKQDMTMYYIRRPFGGYKAEEFWSESLCNVLCIYVSALST